MSTRMFGWMVVAILAMGLVAPSASAFELTASQTVTNGSSLTGTENGGAPAETITDTGGGVTYNWSDKDGVGADASPGLNLNPSGTALYIRTTDATSMTFDLMGGVAGTDDITGGGSIYMTYNGSISGGITISNAGNIDVATIYSNTTGNNRTGGFITVTQNGAFDATGDIEARGKGTAGSGAIQFTGDGGDPFEVDGYVRTEMSAGGSGGTGSITIKGYNAVTVGTSGTPTGISSNASTGTAGAIKIGASGNAISGDVTIYGNLDSRGRYCGSISIYSDGEVEAGGILANAAATLNGNGGDITVVHTGDFTVTGADGVNGRADDTTSGSNPGDISITGDDNGAFLVSSGSVRTAGNTGATITILDYQSVTVTSGDVSISAGSTGGGVAIGAPGNPIGGAITVGGNVSTSCGSNSGPVSLYADGNVSVGGILTKTTGTNDTSTGSMTVVTGGDFTATGGLDSSRARSLHSAGSISITSAGSLTVGGTITANGGAGDGVLRLASTGGSISVGDLNCALFAVHATDPTLDAGTGRSYIVGALANYAAGQIKAPYDQIVFYDDNLGGPGGVVTLTATGSGTNAPKLVPLDDWALEWAVGAGGTWDTVVDGSPKDWVKLGTAVEADFTNTNGLIVRFAGEGAPAAITVGENVTCGGIELMGDDQYIVSPSAAETITLNGTTDLGGDGSFALPAVVSASGTATHVIDNELVLASHVTINTATASGGLSITADISGSFDLTKIGPGTLTLTPDTSNTYANTTVKGGTLAISAAGQLGTGSVTVDGGTLDLNSSDVFLAGGQHLTVNGGTVDIDEYDQDLHGGKLLMGGGTITGTGIVKSDVTYELQAGTVNAELADGSVSGVTGASKTVGGTLTINSDCTYTGATSVSAGTLTIGSTGSIVSDATVTGGTLNVQGTVAGTATVTSSGVLKGSGTVAGLVTIGDGSTGGTLSPGNSVGQLTFGAGSDWLDAGSYTWEINDATGTAGIDPGWDLVTITGILDLSALSAGGFTINLTTLSGASAGAMANFDANQDYTNWTIASATSISGFEAGDFVLDDSGFQNGTLGLAGPGEFSIVQSGNDLVLQYTAATGDSPISWQAINGDADSGIGTSVPGESRTYTHAIDFGAVDDDVVINGVTFDAILGNGSATDLTPNPYGFADEVNGGTGTYATGGGTMRSYTAYPDHNTATGKLGDLLDDMMYTATPTGVQTFKLTDLEPGVEYTLRLYSRAWTDSDRTVDLVFDDGVGTYGITVDQGDASSVDSGWAWDQPYYLEFVYTAPASGEVVVEATPQAGTTWFFYGVTNSYDTPPVPEPAGLGLIGIVLLGLKRRRRS